MNCWALPSSQRLTMRTLAIGPQAIKEILFLSRYRHLLKYTLHHLRRVVLCRALLGVQHIAHTQTMGFSPPHGPVIILAP